MPGLSPEGEAFLAHLAGRGRAPNTLAAYRRDLVAYERFLADRRLTVTAAGEPDVAAYVGSLEAAGRRPASVTRALVALRALHRWCGSDAAAGIESPEPSPAAQPVLTEAEAAALVESAGGRSATARRDRALLELLYGTGGRISEVVGLAVGDAAGGLARIGGRSARVVPYGDQAAVALEAWLEPAGRVTLAGRGEGALFVNAQGGQLSRQWGWSVVRSHGERTGLAGRLGPHVLRHSFAAHLADRGAPPPAVRQLLVGQPAVYDIDTLVQGYRRWHPRGVSGPSR
ncbi:MAG TPA: tyrosine-type recombinase/integrase [Acidimicrobiales bacterium]|nr:tyrosine-type recombinase/integrase [Acidimicrobiales bacterium]